MQTTIRVRLSEISPSFLEKLRVAFEQLTDRKDPEIDIVLSDVHYDPEFVEQTGTSALELKNGQAHVFTLESLQEFVRS